MSQLQIRTRKGRPQTWGLYAPSTTHWVGEHDMVLTNYAAMSFPTPKAARKYRASFKRELKAIK